MDDSGDDSDQAPPKSVTWADPVDDSRDPAELAEEAAAEAETAAAAAAAAVAAAGANGGEGKEVVSAKRAAKASAKRALAAATAAAATIGAGGGGGSNGGRAGGRVKDKEAEEEDERARQGFQIGAVHLYKKQVRVSSDDECCPHLTDRDLDPLDHIGNLPVFIVCCARSLWHISHPESMCEVVQITRLSPGDMICSPCRTYRSGIHLP